MKNLINLIENNKVITNREKEMLIVSISTGSTVSVKNRMEQTEIKMAMLEILHNTNEEMTITEIKNRFKSINGYTYTVQRFSAMARQLVGDGMVNRNTILTNNSIIINGKRYPEEIAKFSLKNA